ncbi:hypothetical protein BU23DRAFT_560229 [Bimuria novae-zelandiae CBS 107.79]|uniref:Uncharacterized protein n=1 Tax=Bimuria novae-zelandiae CBS 107.79 TaxID=1447943 RepID=A0A6A5UMF6_9PLEO|nr:hypothetical protein BU23DRAFT_560229 [Bimuria novae-zelandiae CBS 107.79]
MSPYQHLFSTNAVLNVWRNLRNTRDQNDLLLSFHVHPDDVRTSRDRRYGKGGVVETTSDETGRKNTADGRGVVDGRSSIGFVVPWRSMQAQKKELREKEKELADALVVLAGEVSFADLPPALQSSLTQNPLIQVRHLAAGLSRQMSRVEIQMADNEPFASGKNLYSGGELIRKYLPDIETLFQQRPTPQRMIFELLMELKDLVYAGMLGCDREVVEWDLNNFSSFEDLDEAVVRAITPLPSDHALIGARAAIGKSEGSKKLLRRRPSMQVVSSRPWLHDEAEILYHLESLDTTAAAMSHLPVPVTDFVAKSVITLRRTLPRQVLNDHSLAKRKRTGRCVEYARCMKWAGTSWRQGGGCRRGCKNEDEDPEGLPSWHSSSRWFDQRGTYMVGGGKVDAEGKMPVSKIREI